MAEDLTQDTFVKMFRALGTFDPRLRFSSWLFRIAHNTAIDYLRQRRLALVTPPVDDDEEARDTLASIADIAAMSPEEAASNRELAAALDAAIERLAAGVSIGDRAASPGGTGIRRDCARARPAARHGEDLSSSRPARAGTPPRCRRIRS